MKNVDPLKQKGGPQSEVLKDTKAVKGAKKKKKKESSGDGESRKNLMKMKVQFRTWHNIYKL